MGLRNTSSTATTKARKLRKDMGQAERKLWALLRAHRLGFHVKRQYPFGPFVLDFYVSEVKLCIELDGDLHLTRALRDNSRDKYLAKCGVSTLRIRTDELYENQDYALFRIVSAYNERVGLPLPDRPIPSSKRIKRMFPS